MRAAGSVQGRGAIRPRHELDVRWVRVLKLSGFRYSVSRDAYVLRFVGNRFGPVYRVR